MAVTGNMSTPGTESRRPLSMPASSCSSDTRDTFARITSSHSTPSSGEQSGAPRTARVRCGRLKAITATKSAVSLTQSLCSGVAVSGAWAGSHAGAGAGPRGGELLGNTGGGAVGGMQVGVAERGVSTGGASFRLVAPWLLARGLSGLEALRPRELLFSGEAELRDLELESRVEWLEERRWCGAEDCLWTEASLLSTWPGLV